MSSPADLPKDSLSHSLSRYPNLSPRQMVDHLFRQEAGKIIAVLTRIFGIHNLGLVEDTVQETFLKALQTWEHGVLPDNPSAWLMQVARNRTIDLIRRQQKMPGFSEELSQRLQSDAENTIQEFFLDTEIADSQLRMIFTCCHYLLQCKPIPIVQLNRAVVLGEVEGFPAAIDSVLNIPGIAGLLEQQHIYAVVLGELYLRAGNLSEGRRILEHAERLTPSLAEKKRLREMLTYTG